MNKYRFEIYVQTKYIKMASKLMNTLDISGEFCTKEIMTFNSKKDLVISTTKELIKQAYASVENEVLFIEGGKVE